MKMTPTRESAVEELGRVDGFDGCPPATWIPAYLQEPYNKGYAAGKKEYDAIQHEQSYWEEHDHYPANL